MTKAKELPSVEILNDFLRYDKESGILYWKHRPRKYFDSDRKYSYWNKRFQNKQANHIHFKKEKNYQLLVKRQNNHKYGFTLRLATKGISFF